MKKNILLSIICIGVLTSSCGDEEARSGNLDDNKGDTKEKVEQEVSNKVQKATLQNEEENSMSKLCECFEIGMMMTEELNGTEGDDEEIKALEIKYATEMEACELLNTKMEAEMKNSTEEERMTKILEFTEACPAAKEMMNL